MGIVHAIKRRLQQTIKKSQSSESANSAPDMEADTLATDSQLNVFSSVSVYFRVEEISPATDGCFVCKADETTLIRRGSSNARPTPYLENFEKGLALFAEEGDHQSWKSAMATLPQLDTELQTVESLIKLFEPSLRDVSIHPAVMIQASRGSRLSEMLHCLSDHLGLHFIECREILGETDSKMTENLHARLLSALNMAPCLVHLPNLDLLGKANNNAPGNNGSQVLDSFMQFLHELEEESDLPHTFLVVASTEDPERLEPELRGCFHHEIRLEAPDEENRYNILKSLCQAVSVGVDVNLQHLASRTAAFTNQDLHALVHHACHEALKRITCHITQDKRYRERDLVLAGAHVSNRDFNIALDALHAGHSQLIGAAKIPNVTWDDVGGLAAAKAEIMETIQLPLERPELFENGFRQRSGVLFYGPPGTGKTLLAKAVATSLSLNFISVKGPELINPYVGESERNVRNLFSRARDAKPCVIFFDELDSLAPNRGKQGDSGGVMDRVVSQLLAEIDGVGKGRDVFVIGATNRPDLLDPALLRPGRFDKLVYLGISEDHDSQLKIIQALTRKFRLAPELDLKKIAKMLPLNLTGADLYALCSDAMLAAFSRKVQWAEDEVANLKEQGRTDVTVQRFLASADASALAVMITEDDFVKAADALVPSVSVEELAKYKEVQQKFQQP